MSSHPYMTDHYQEQREKGQIKKRNKKLEEIKDIIDGLDENINSYHKYDESELNLIYYALKNRRKIFRNKRLIDLLG